MDGKTKTVRKFTECNLTGMRSKGRRNIDGETKSGEMDISRQGRKSLVWTGAANRNPQGVVVSVEDYYYYYYYVKCFYQIVRCVSVGPKVSLDGCGKSRPPPRIRSPDRPARSESLYRLSCPGPRNSLNSERSLSRLLWDSHCDQ